MKKSIIVILLLAFVFVLQAQDVIVLRDATEIESRVLEITENSVKYKKWNNLDGPTYAIAAENVFFIKFANGTKEVFNTSPQAIFAEQKVEDDSLKFSKVRPFIKGARFQAYLTFGFFYGRGYLADALYSYYAGRGYKIYDYCYSIGLDLMFSLGVRIFDYAFVGFKTGTVVDIWGLEWNNAVLPLTLQVDFRGYIPVSKVTYPYVEFSPGIELDCLHLGHTYFAYQLGTGVDINHFSFGIGYYQGAKVKTFYMKFGAKFGGKQ